MNPEIELCFIAAKYHFILQSMLSDIKYRKEPT
jgi:hypothetical protein